MTATQPPAQDVSDPALIEFSSIKLWFFRDLVDAQRKALFLLCGFSDAVTHGELDTHSAQLRALRHALRIDAARELQQAQVVGEAELDAKAKAMFDAQKDPLAAPWERQWSETIKYWREKAATPQPSAPVVGEALLKRAYEVVHHELDCPSIGGNGDKDCKCDAVPFLRDLESALTGRGS